MAGKNQAAHGPPKGRRYIKTAETVGYIMFDSMDKVRIGPGQEWVDRILNVSMGMQALLGPIKRVWDIINDFLVAALVEKTRTRWGKFRPYLILYPLYGLPMTLVYFMLPFIFWGTDNTYLPKILMWLAFDLFNELTGTIFQIARMGCAPTSRPTRMNA